MRKRVHDPKGVSPCDDYIGFEGRWTGRCMGQIEELLDWRKAEGWFDNNRTAQSRFWFKEEIRQGLLSMLDDEKVKEEMSALMNMVDNGEIYSSAAAQKILKKYTAKPT